MNNSLPGSVICLFVGAVLGFAQTGMPRGAAAADFTARGEFAAGRSHLVAPNLDSAAGPNLPGLAPLDQDVEFVVVPIRRAPAVLPQILTSGDVISTEDGRGGSGYPVTPQPPGRPTPRPVRQADRRDGVIRPVQAQEFTGPPDGTPTGEAPPRDIPLYPGDALSQTGVEAPGFYIAGDYLIWKPRQPALVFAVGQTDPTRGPVLLLPQRLDLGWDSGARVEVGYHCDAGWEVDVGYTYFHSTANGGAVAPPGGLILSFVPGCDCLVAAGANARLNYHVIDVEVAHCCHSCDRFSYRLFGGPRIALINQEFNSFFTSVFPASDFVVSNPSRFNGYGLAAGGEVCWEFCKGFGVFGRLGGALLVGRVRTDLVATTVNGASILAIPNRLYRTVPVAEMAAGLAWTHGPVQVSVGYELANWFNVIDRLSLGGGNVPAINASPSDLGLDGLFVRLSFKY